jgi:hypothetical protein
VYFSYHLYIYHVYYITIERRVHKKSIYVIVRPTCIRTSLGKNTTYNILSTNFYDKTKAKPLFIIFNPPATCNLLWWQTRLCFFYYNSIRYRYLLLNSLTFRLFFSFFVLVVGILCLSEVFVLLKKKTFIIIS